MTILSLETCSSLCGAAIVRDGVIVGRFSINISNLHDEKLLGIVDNLLKACSLTIDDIDGYAVSIGPGSFTGIRIGMSVAKGFAVAKDKPLVGVSVLDSLACKIWNISSFFKTEKVCSVIDAKRDEVYYALYEIGGEIKRISDYECKTLADLKAIVPADVLFVGDAAIKVKESFGSDHYLFSTGDLNDNDPGVIAMLGYQRLIINDKDDAEKLEPLYIKDFKPITKNKGDI